MKKYFLLLLIVPIFSFAQNKSCCKINSTQSFGQLASTDAFRESHAAPLPLEYNSQKGDIITFKTPDGKDARAFEIRSEKSSDKWLLVFHEWWGLNDYIKRESERLYSSLPDVNILAIDLYDGAATDKPEEAQKLVQSVNSDRVIAMIKGAIDHAGTNAKIATLGWCFGGGWSLQAGILAGKQGIGCVMYYGMPETDISKLKSLNAEVLGIFASKDDHITPDMVKIFENNMKAAGKKVTIYSYDAVHAFANPSNPKFNKEAATEANAKALTFLKEKLK